MSGDDPEQPWAKSLQLVSVKTQWALCNSKGFFTYVDFS